MNFFLQHKSNPVTYLPVLRLGLLATTLMYCPTLPALAAEDEHQAATIQTQGLAPVKTRMVFPFRAGERVAWIGSSSTSIGVWPKTIEFLLRTRHPDLNLRFQRFTTGSGTFHTALQNLDKWLGEFKPTLVVFNY